MAEGMTPGPDVPIEAQLNGKEAGDHAVLRLDSVILASRPINFIVGPLEALFPEFLETLSLAL